jgi:hypothetical protein
MAPSARGENIMIKLACPNPGCRRSLNAGDGLAGRRVKCPACGGSIAVPDRHAEDDDEEVPRRKTRARHHDDDDDAPRRKSRRHDDDDSGPRRKAATGLLASKGLSSLAAILFFVGATFLVLLAISTFFPWVTINLFGMSTSASGLSGGFVGWLILILSLLLAVFAVVAFFVLNSLIFKISLWSSFGWGLVAALLTLLNIINGPGGATIQTGAPKMSMDGLGGDLGNMAPKMGDMKVNMGDLSAKMGDASSKMGDAVSKLGDMGPKIGFGLWLAFVLGLLTSADFGFLSVRSLFGGAAKRSRSDDDD